MGRTAGKSARAASLECPGDTRRARFRHHHLPARRRRGGADPAPGLRRAGGRPGGASQEPRARRLGHERRAAAGQEGRHEPRASSPTVLAERAGRRRRASRRSRSPGPGFLNITLDAAAPGELARDHRRGRRRRTAAATRSPASRVNLEFVSANPTGPIHLGGTRWAAVGDALAPGPGGAGRRRSPASTTSTTTAPRSTGSRASLLAAAHGRAGPEDGYARRLHRRHRRRGRRGASRTCSDAARRPRRRRSSGPRGVELMFAEIKAYAARVRHRLRRLLPRELAARVAARSTAPSTRLRELGRHLRAGRRVVAAHHGLRRRQGPRRHQDRRRGRLHRRRPRLLPGQARARLRPVHLHARRRPPRLHRPAEGDARRASATTRDEPRGPHRPDGQPRHGRRSRCG